jgi:hypothetical protein
MQHPSKVKRFIISGMPSNVEPYSLDDLNYRLQIGQILMHAQVKDIETGRQFPLAAVVESGTLLLTGERKTGKVPAQAMMEAPAWNG